MSTINQSTGSTTGSPKVDKRAQSFLTALSAVSKVQKKEYDDKTADATRKQEIKSEAKHTEQQVQTIKNPILNQTVARLATDPLAKDSFTPPLAGSAAQLGRSEEKNLLGKIQNTMDLLASLNKGEQTDDVLHQATTKSAVLPLEDEHLPTNNLKMGKNAASLNSPAKTKSTLLPKGTLAAEEFAHFEEGAVNGNFQFMNNTQAPISAIFSAYTMILDNSSRNTLQFAATGVQTNTSNLKYLIGSLKSMEASIESSTSQMLSAASMERTAAVTGAFQGLSGIGQGAIGMATPTGAGKQSAEAFGHVPSESMKNMFNNTVLHGPEKTGEFFKTFGLAGQEPAGELAPLFKKGGLEKLTEAAKNIAQKFSSHGADKIDQATAEKAFAGAFCESLKPIAQDAAGNPFEIDSPEELNARTTNFENTLKRSQATSKRINEIHAQPLFAVEKQDGSLSEVAVITEIKPEDINFTNANGEAIQIKDAEGVSKKPTTAAELHLMWREHIGDGYGSIATQELEHGQINAAQPNKPQEGVIRKQTTTYTVGKTEGKDVEVQIVTNVMKLNGTTNKWESEKGIVVLAKFKVNARTAENLRIKSALDSNLHSELFEEFQTTGKDFAERPARIAAPSTEGVPDTETSPQLNNNTTSSNETVKDVKEYFSELSKSNEFKTFHNYGSDRAFIKKHLDAIGIGGLENTPAAKMGAESARLEHVRSQRAHTLSTMAHVTSASMNGVSGNMSAQSRTLSAQASAVSSRKDKLNTEISSVTQSQSAAQGSLATAVQSAEQQAAQDSQTFAQAINSAAR